MSSSIFQYFNSSKNPKLIVHLHLVSNSNMFPRPYSSSRELKLPLKWSRSLKFIMNPLENLDAPKMENFPLDQDALEMDNPPLNLDVLEMQNFVVFEILP